VNIQRHPCRILPGEFDSLIPMPEFVSQLQSPKAAPNSPTAPTYGSNSLNTTTKNLVDSVVCQLFSIMAQYESLNRQSRMIGDFKQTLVARSSQDIILLVPFISNPQPEPEADCYPHDFGPLSMTQSFNVQYYCLQILRAFSRMDSTHYSLLQGRINKGIASPNDLNVLFSVDQFVPGKSREHIETFFRHDWSKYSVYSMVDYLRLCFVNSTKIPLAVELVEKDSV